MQLRLLIFHSFLQVSFAELYIEHMLYWLYFTLGVAMPVGCRENFCDKMYE
jgi:hypothetical protein